MKLTRDEVTVLRYYELCGRAYDGSYKRALKSVYNQELIRETGRPLYTIITPEGRKALEELKNDNKL